MCITTNPIFVRYRAYFVSLVLTAFLSVIITVLFRILAYRNVEQLTYRTVPLIRLELDKQLTKMILLNFSTGIPLFIANALTINPNITDDNVVWAKLQFSFAITLLFFYSYIAVSKKHSEYIINLPII
jgi:hypothetical protein